jgi:SAM-dependent methyltransferase
VTATSDRYFDQQWSDTDDPWDQVGRFSEQRKYDLTVGSLTRPRFRRAFEPGCATGSLTARLADRVDALVAWDRHPHAVAAAAERCASLLNVSIAEGRLPDWPEGRFDLIVFSEILYYFDVETIDAVLEGAHGRLEPAGQLVACHYRPFVVEHAVTGAVVHARIGHDRWRPLAQHLEPDFLLEVFERR